MRDKYRVLFACRDTGIRGHRSTSRVRGDKLMTPDHNAIHVLNAEHNRAGIGGSSWKGLNSGRHEIVVYAAG